MLLHDRQKQIQPFRWLISQIILVPDWYSYLPQKGFSFLIREFLQSPNNAFKDMIYHKYFVNFLYSIKKLIDLFIWIKIKNMYIIELFIVSKYKSIFSFTIIKIHKQNTSKFKFKKYVIKNKSQTSTNFI